MGDNYNWILIMPIAYFKDNFPYIFEIIFDFIRVLFIYSNFSSIMKWN